MDGLEGDPPKAEKTGMRLLSLVNAVAISVDDANTLVGSYRDRSERQYPDDGVTAHQERIARAIIKRYARLAAISGGATALPVTVPGLGTALAMLGGGSIDLGVCLKLQVDMCRCLAASYGHDLTSEDAKHLSMLLALFGTLEGLGETAAVKLGTKAGVSVLRRYLRGAVLQTIKSGFSTVGVRFSRKALEKSAPFGVGVVVGIGLNYGITYYVGNEARAWLRIDQEL